MFAVFHLLLYNKANGSGKTGENTKNTASAAKSCNNININHEHKSRLFSYIFGREETKKRTLSLGRNDDILKAANDPATDPYI